jgi:hypothetical protein
MVADRLNPRLLAAPQQLLLFGYLVDPFRDERGPFSVQGGSS